jgi:hypothetical protein
VSWKWFFSPRLQATMQVDLSRRYRLCSDKYQTKDLIEQYPPYFADKNKRHVLNLHHPQEPYNGQISYSRWNEIPLPESYTNDNLVTIHEMKEDIFSYDDESSTDVTIWHLNFADKRLFFAYSGPLFAQDEVQVVEHPILASLIEHLKTDFNHHERRQPLTSIDDRPTPILIKGAQRRVNIELLKSKLYGNNFSRASLSQINQATTVLHPQTISNILAIEAPKGGRGEYTLKIIKYILSTCYTGFKAAKLESNGKCVIHTGLWGTGAYGGNKTLMAMLQVLGARLAQVDVLVYHTFLPGYSDTYREALRVLDEELVPPGTSFTIDEVMQKIQDLKISWGVPDGN